MTDQRVPEFVFPFGASHAASADTPSGKKPVVVLGANPSALYVRWTPPEDSGLRPIAALAVAPEPEPLWNGSNEEQLVKSWMADWFHGHGWGTVTPAGRLNGSSGRWVDEKVLQPLGIQRQDVWFTDCVDTYRCSKGNADRIADTYREFAASRSLPEARLLPHPSEDAIVTESARCHLQRLNEELLSAEPSLVITLGSAAARVFRLLVESEELPANPLVDLPAYGTEHLVSHEARSIQWLALSHPEAPAPWRKRHEAWSEAKRSEQSEERPPKWLPLRLLEAGKDAPAVLVKEAVRRMHSGARERAREARAADTEADIDELVARVIRSHRLLARAEGATAGLALTAAEVTSLIGSAGTLTLPAAVVGLSTDLTMLAWIQARMVLEIAALRGATDDKETLAREILVLWGLHSPTKAAGAALGKGSERVAKRLLLRHLRGEALAAIKAMFRVFGIRFARIGVIRALPVINIPINAAVNDLSTKALGKRADAYYRLRESPGAGAG